MSGMSDRSKLLLFAALTMFGIGVGSALMYGLGNLMLPAGMTLDQVLENPTADVQEALKWANTGMLLGFFLFPVLAYRLLFGRTNAFSLGFTKSSHWWWSAPIILIFLSGVADILGAFNGWIMDQLQMQSLDDMQNSANQLQTIMLSPTTGVQWLSTVIAVVIAPAVLEELFFRGAIQNLLYRSVGNPHTAIWASAAAFSAMHMQFEGFLPRLFLGVIMGYLYHWSGSLTTAIIAHASNNALALVLYTIFQSLEWQMFDSPLLQLLISFGMGFVGIAVTQWAYRKSHSSSALEQE